MDKFGGKAKCFASCLDSVHPFWILGVIFEKLINYIWAVKPIVMSAVLAYF